MLTLAYCIDWVKSGCMHTCHISGGRIIAVNGARTGHYGWNRQADLELVPHIILTNNFSLYVIGIYSMFMN